MDTKNLNHYSNDEILRLLLANQITLFQKIDCIQEHLRKHVKDSNGNRDDKILSSEYSGLETLEMLINKMDKHNQEIEYYLSQ